MGMILLVLLQDNGPWGTISHYQSQSGPAHGSSPSGVYAFHDATVWHYVCFLSTRIAID